jgi:predicted transcriptional regulator
MKSVLISIQPKWCELIASGKKTVEVRKTRPKIDTPFKVYIYETNWKNNTYWKNHHKDKLGKVIGEFVCNDIECFTTDYRANQEQTDRISAQSCVSWGNLMEYEVNSPCLYAWHISDLIIYDEPKCLGDFHHCGVNYHFDPVVTKPPQSWCYVEKVGEG